jgi:hypothetical protein
MLGVTSSVVFYFCRVNSTCCILKRTVTILPEFISLNASVVLLKTKTLNSYENSLFIKIFHEGPAPNGQYVCVTLWKIADIGDSLKKCRL